MLTAALSGSGCTSVRPESSLYQRLGGTPVLNTVVNETMDTVTNDPRTKRSFEGVKLSTLKQSIVTHLCVLTGGPCTYEGETMSKVHRDARITDAEFDLMVAAMRESLDRHTGTAEKNELLKLLAPMKRDIVTGP